MPIPLIPGTLGLIHETRARRSIFLSPCSLFFPAPYSVTPNPCSSSLLHPFTHSLFHCPHLHIITPTRRTLYP
jgi:hypothetical protein